MFLSPKSTTVKVAVQYASMASTQKETVTGSISPAKAGRLVIVEVRADGSWSEAARTTTDSTGQYKAQFGIADLGDQQVRVRVEKDGRQKAVVSTASPVKVLNPTQLQVAVPKFARTDRPLRISGRVGPAAARMVSIEQSADGQTWTSVGQGTSAPNGQFTVTASGFSAGDTQLRVTVAASDTEASTSSDAQAVSVEDYKAAGRKYLQIVAPLNKLIDEYNTLTTDFGRARELAKKMSTESTKEARQLRKYAYWPQEVKSAVDLLAKRCILEADYYHQLANTKTTAEFLGLDYPETSKAADNAPVVIRAALGLPKRD
jgi:hypothetical protein